MRSFLQPFAKCCTHPAAALAGLCALTVLVRAPFNLNTGTTEAFYLVVARQWLDGMPPYAFSFDVKPPLLFLLMAGSEVLFGPSLIAAKMLCTAAAAMTACGLYLFGRRTLGTLAGAAGAILYTFSSLTLGSTFSTAETIMAPFTAFAMLAGITALLERRRSALAALFLSGLLSGAAFCIKQTAAFTAFPIILGLLFYLRRGSRLEATAVFAAGCCTVPLGFVLYFLSIGHSGELINDTVIAALHRAGSSYSPWYAAFGTLMEGLLAVLPAVIMAGLFWVARRPLRGQPAYPSILFLAAWAGTAWLGILAVREVSITYLLPLLQPLCLAAGGFVQHVLGRASSARLRWSLRGGALASAILYSCYLAMPVYYAGSSEVKAAEAAADLMARAGKRPEDRLLVVDRDVLVYLTSGSEPAHAIFHPLHLLCGLLASGTRSALAESMESRPAFVVMADRPVTLQCEDPALRAAMEARLARDYCELGHFNSSVAAWPGQFTVYGLAARLDTGSGLRCGKRYSLH